MSLILTLKTSGEEQLIGNRIHTLKLRNQLLR